MSFSSKLARSWQESNSLLCIGLDPDVDKLPAKFSGANQPLFEFNKAIIEATHDLVCAYKLNSAFYESAGAKGIEQLLLTCQHISDNYPNISIILDFKRGDIGNTNEHYARFAFDYLKTDAITVQPWQGSEALQPFLDRQDKGILVLCRTSNPGAGEFQDQLVAGQPLYSHVAKAVATSWNKNNNCGLVVGATYLEEMATIRALVGGDMIFLVPGFGAQGGDLAGLLPAGLNSHKTGLVVNSSRAILYSSQGDDFAESARQAAEAAKNEINKYR